MTKPRPDLPDRDDAPNPAQPVTGHANAVVGLQWGDEGKGKIIDLLTPHYDAIVRYNGGANAGHSVQFAGKRFALHLLPSGILHPGVLAIIANGLVVDPFALVKELDTLSAQNIDTSGLVLSDRAHLVLPYHQTQDALREQLLTKDDTGRAIGTTKRGIGPAYAEKANRSSAIRAGDLLRPDTLRERLEHACRFHNTLHALDPDTTPHDPDTIFDSLQPIAERLRPHITDTTYLLHQLLRDNKRILFEGANATLLDIDHGTFPFVTSSSTTALGIPSGAGIPGKHITDILGIAKAYSTRVGAGPFPTELHDDTAHTIRERGREYGTTTGRPRRCGWLDLVALRYSTMINAADALSIMLLDVLSGLPELKLCIAYEFNNQRIDRFLPDATDLARATPIYETLPGFSEDITGARTPEDLPPNARAYLQRIEQCTGTPIRFVSVGPDREQTIDMQGGSKRSR